MIIVRRHTLHKFIGTACSADQTLMFLAAVLLLHMFVTGDTQAPGDEDSACVDLQRIPPFSQPPVYEITLMKNSNYNYLLESNGGPWIVVDEDNNNDDLMGNSTSTVCQYSYSLACRPDHFSFPHSIQLSG